MQARRWDIPSVGLRRRVQRMLIREEFHPLHKGFGGNTHVLVHVLLEDVRNVVANIIGDMGSKSRPITTVVSNEEYRGRKGKLTNRSPQGFREQVPTIQWRI